jgi:hypothetical protein
MPLQSLPSRVWRAIESSLLVGRRINSLTSDDLLCDVNDSGDHCALTIARREKLAPKFQGQGGKERYGRSVPLLKSLGKSSKQ